MRIATAPRTAAADGIVDAIDTGAGTAKLQVRTGTAPAAITDAAAGTLLAEFNLPNPCFGAAVNGVATASAITAVSGVAAGTAGHWRVIDRAGTAVMDSNSVGTAATELILNTTTISVGVNVSITAFTVTMPTGTA